MMKPWMTVLAVLTALLVQSCAMPASTGNAPPGAAKPMPDFGNKAYGY
jgi:hypothetical protein